MELNGKKPYVGVMISTYSPSVSFNVFGSSIEIGLELGAWGGSLDFTDIKNFKLTAANGIGFTLKMEPI